MLGCVREDRMGCTGEDRMGCAGFDDIHEGVNETDARGDENPGGERNTSVIDLHNYGKGRTTVPGESAPTALAAPPPRLRAAARSARSLRHRRASRRRAAGAAALPPCPPHAGDSRRDVANTCPSGM